MRDLFRGYYRHSEEEFKELWEHCTFVLDTNVLLNLYRYPHSAREDLFRVLNKVSTRLWIPHQVALEYQQNRLTEIAKQVRKFDEVRAVLEKCRRDLDGLARDLEKRHSTIEMKGFLEQINKPFSDFERQLSEKETEHFGVESNDELRDRIGELLGGRVGEPLSGEELATLYREGEQRYKDKRPPGYEDRAKADDKEKPCHFVGKLAIRREYGDLIVWKQIIGYASSQQIEHLIFVTDDDKTDWWWRVESKGPKTIGPRPELTHELMEQSDVKLFYMYNTERLLRFAQQYLEIMIKPESIALAEEIRVQVHQLSGLSNLRNGVPLAEIYRSVGAWATASSGDSSFFKVNDSGEGGIDLVVMTRHVRIGYQIEVMSTYETPSIEPVSRRFEKRSGLAQAWDLSSITLVVVFFPVDARWRVMVETMRNQLHAAGLTGVSFGYIDFPNLSGGARFVPIAD